MTIQKFIIQIASVLDQLKIPYLITGGVAVSCWGKPRYTADVDIVVEIESSDKVEGLIGLLKKKSPNSYADRDSAIDAFRRKSEFNLIEPEYGLKADFFFSKASEHHKLAMERGKNKKIGGKMIRFVSPEDLIISKLQWFKEGQSTRQLEDIVSVMDIQTDLDTAYLERWIKKLDLQNEWQELKRLPR